MAVEREVLVLQCSTGVSVLRNLYSNWTFIRYKCLEAAGQYLTHSEASVGIIDCSGAEQPDPKLENWLDSYKGVFWVAVLSKCQLSRKEWQLFVATHCYDYHTTPILEEKLFITIGRAYGMTNLKNNLSLSFQRSQVVGVHDSFKKVLRYIDRHSEGGLTLSGESGTGKRLLAETWANIKGFRFVELSAKINENELDNYLSMLDFIFKKRTIRSFCLCIFDIEFLPVIIQVYICNLISSSNLNSFELIFCCNVDSSEINEVNLISPEFMVLLKNNWIVLPPLRDRGQDKIILARHYLYKISRKQKKRLLGFSNDAEQAILKYDWPGNVTQLIEKVFVGVSSCEDNYLNLKLMEFEDKHPPEEYTNMSLIEAREEAEALAIERALNLVSGRPGQAAELLCISRASLYRLIARYGIRR
ncbi:VpsR-related response regulator [Oceanisphaera sp. IT1-181]|uniref:VpsR-related response regulator n=1 Tax=Oceanisphaera sp. IT1-181 TaxID=3081199 RepID=UPI0029CA3B2C|nr:VpsR-related response regulator [Oceanisphaera sp. IT1-181]